MTLKQWEWGEGAKEGFRGREGRVYSQPWPSVSVVPTGSCVVLYIVQIYWKKSACKWTHTVQSHVFQGQLCSLHIQAGLLGPGWSTPFYLMCVHRRERIRAGRDYRGCMALPSSHRCWNWGQTSDMIVVTQSQNQDWALKYPAPNS